MTTASPAVPNPAEIVRRSTRVLAAFMSQQQAQMYSGQTLDPVAFLARGQAYVGRVPALPATSATARMHPLSAKGQHHVTAVQANPAFASIYGQGAQFAMVELGKLVAFQWSVDMDHSAGVHGANLAATPSEDDVLNCCLPPSIVPVANSAWSAVQKTPDRQQASVTISTTDLTFDVANGFPLINQMSGQVLAAVSSGANLMLVRQHGTHLVLANGYHRAYVLLSRGVDFVPVVLVTVPRQEDLVPDGFLSPQVVFGQRQPMVDDFLDDALAMTVETRAMMKVVRMTFESLLVPRLV